jgi:hypothetical protein
MNNNAVKLLRALVEISVKNPAPRKAEYAGSWKSFLIAVDKDNTAEILMPEEVYNKLLEVKVSPTPREQELEEQNKVLWELVGENSHVLSGLSLAYKSLCNQHGRPFCDIDGSWYSHAQAQIAAIQKAKESHKGDGREKQK